MRKSVRDLALEDKAFFCKYPLGLKIAPHQIKWCDFFHTYDKLMLMAPSDHGKTTIAICHAIHEIVKNRNKRIILASNRDDLAAANMRMMQTQLTQNKKLIEMFGTFKEKGKPWSDYETEVIRPGLLRDSTLYACGVGTRSLGRRSDLIICDDILDIRNSSKREQREKVKRWFYEELLRTLEPGGEIAIIGTYQHTEDLYHELLNDEQFYCVLQRAILNESTREVLWPEKWSYERLDKRRRHNYQAFMKCYQNVIVESKELWLSRNIVDLALDKTKIIRPKIEEKFDFVIGSVDPAYTVNKQSKFSAISVIGIHLKDREFFTVEGLYFWRDKVPYAFLKQKIRLVNSMYTPGKWVIETNQAQGALLQDLEIEGLPVESHYTTAKKHDVREGLPAVSNLFIDRRMKLPYGDINSQRIVDTLIDEMLTYPDGKYSDLLMSLYLAICGTDRLAVPTPAKVRNTKQAIGGRYELRRKQAVRSFQRSLRNIRHKELGLRHSA